MFGASGSGFGGFGQNNQQQQQQQQPNQQQPAAGGLFGQSTPSTGFGGFGSQQPATFGASSTTGGGLFGQQPQQQPQQPQQPSTGFTFGQNSTSSPFGQQQNPPAGGGFGASTSGTSSGGFGGAWGAVQNNNQPAQPAFGSSGSNAFGAKPAGGLFGQPQPQQQQQPAAGGAFGQPATGGLFGGGLSASQTGGMPSQGTSNPPYQAFVNNEKDASGGGSTNYQYNTITCMPAYRAASVEELRVQDYNQGRKSGTQGPATGALGGFGQPASTPAFGASSTGGGLFGQQPQQQQPQQQQPSFGGGLFGQSQNNQQPQQGGGLFGSTPSTTGSGGLFGQQNQQQNTQQSGGLFGQSNQQGSSGFTFGQPAANQQTNTSSGFTFGQNNQQNKPGGLFGNNTNTSTGFGSTGQSGGGFTFGANNNNNNQQQQQPSTGFGASSGGGFSFGANNQTNQQKPGGLFGSSTSTAPSFGGFGASASTSQPEANKPAFSFGGFGASSGAPGQSAPAPSGGLFGNTGQQPTTTSQPSTGFSFGGAANTNQNQAGATGGGLFGNAQSQPSGGLFGQQNKPPTGGLFGSQPSQQQQQPQGAAGGFNFGSSSNTGNAGGGLFGSTANKPSGGLFGGTLGASQPTSGGLFNNTSNNPTQTGGLFGGSQPGQGLFGNQQQQNAGAGGGLFGSSSTTGGIGQSTGAQAGGSLFGTQSQPAPNLQTSLNSNPYGTDSLFGGQAVPPAAGGALGTSANHTLSQPHLPFNVSRPSAKKQPPLVPAFRSSTGRSTARLTKLRGSTPGLRESTPGREGSPSLFAPSSPSATGNSLFRGLSDEVPRQAREGTPSSLPSQAFVTRSSVKRLVLDDQTNRSTPALGRSTSLFGARAASAVRDHSPAAGARQSSLFDRATPTASRVNFSPALETAASSRFTPHQLGDESAEDSILGRRRILDESPSKALNGAADVSLPSLSKPADGSLVNKEDALLPLDYYVQPPLSELREWSHTELRSVEGFSVGRKGYGSVEFVEPVDLTSVGQLGNVPGGIVQLRTKECFVYPDEDDCFDPETGRERDGVQPGFDPKRVPGGKAKRGHGLNIPAIVHLEGCWPLDRSTREPIKDGDHLRVKQLISKLKRRTDVEFRGYEPVSGTWSFRVEHFSRYGLDDDDESDGEIPNDADKRQQIPTQDSDSDDAPPVKALDEQEEDAQEDEGMDTHEPTVVQQDVAARRQYSRGSTPTVSRGTPQPSETGSQPWAASLGLEARRMQVMQASFFGGEKEAPPQKESEEKTDKRAPLKKARLPSPSLPIHTGTRETFARPVTETKSKPPSEAAPFELPPVSLSRPRKLAKVDLQSSITDDANDVLLDAGLTMGRSFRVGWGPDGTFVHRAKITTSRYVVE